MIQPERPVHLNKPSYEVRTTVEGEIQYVLPNDEVQYIIKENAKLIIDLADIPMTTKDPELEEKRGKLLKTLEMNLHYLGNLQSRMFSRSFGFVLETCFK